MKQSVKIMQLKPAQGLALLSLLALLALGGAGVSRALPAFVQVGTQRAETNGEIHVGGQAATNGDIHINSQAATNGTIHVGEQAAEGDIRIGS